MSGRSISSMTRRSRPASSSAARSRGATGRTFPASRPVTKRRRSRVVRAASSATFTIRRAGPKSGHSPGDDGGENCYECVDGAATGRAERSRSTFAGQKKEHVDVSNSRDPGYRAQSRGLRRGQHRHGWLQAGAGGRKRISSNRSGSSRRSASTGTMVSCDR